MITKKQFMEEMILNIIKQEYAEIKGYENSFPIPSTDNLIYIKINKIIDNNFINQKIKNYRRVWIKGYFKNTNKISKNGNLIRIWISGYWKKVVIDKMFFLEQQGEPKC